MRYYGMSSETNNTPQQSPMNTTPDFAPMQNTQRQTPVMNEQMTNFSQTTQTPQSSEARTFNRPNPDGGLYNGQRAQNVRSINEWLEEMPPAVMPPGTNPSAMGFPNATVYEYPAPSDMPAMPDRSCPSEMSSVSYLCAHKGKFVRVEFGSNTEKSGILKTVGRNYIVLQEQNSGNNIMCALSSVKAINIHNSAR